MHYADQKRRPHAFEQGMEVLLSSRNIRFTGKGQRKLYPKFLGPFKIIEMIGANAARLQLPVGWKLHDEFHLSLLKQYDGSSSTPIPPPPEIVGDEVFYHVEHILAHRDKSYGKKKVREYLIKWTGYTDDHNSWEPASNLSSDLLKKYSDHK